MSQTARFRCSCGTVLVSSAFGQRVKCSKCQKILLVPNPNPPMTQGTTPTFPATAYNQPARPKRNNQTTLFIVLGSVGVCVLVVGVVLVSFLLMRVSRETKPVAVTNQTNSAENSPRVNHEKRNNSAGNRQTAKKSEDSRPAPGNSPPVNNQAGNSKDEYTIKPPVNWGKEDLSDALGMTIRWNSPRRQDTTYTTFELNIAPIPDNIPNDAKTQLQTVVDTSKQYFKNWQNSEFRSEKINGLEYLTYEWDAVGLQSRRRQKGRVYLANHKNKLVVIAFTSVFQYQKEFEAEFKEFLNSFSLK